MPNKIIGIGGGVGPMAGVELHKKIIENTNAGGTDQGHLDVCHLSFSQSIPDRTKFLLGEVTQDPAEGMLTVAKALAAVGKTAGKQIVMGIPCNTFHAPKIFDHFLELLSQNQLDIEVVHMLKETGEFIKANFPAVKKIGLMSTTGTRRAGVYNQILEPLGFGITEVPAEIQNQLHDSIYNQSWGIKAVSPVSQTARDNFLNFVQILKNQGAQIIILGCTEIPLALPEKEIDGVELVDPMTILARALIDKVAPEKLNSLQ
ncbi:MAG: aspartate/glutamate racemase family protein [Candidatus Buchananbacteria bacterium]|nr:aspartate/glutamate racemase family protein [Candidatus Buchananbacteria bacterium]